MSQHIEIRQVPLDECAHAARMLADYLPDAPLIRYLDSESRLLGAFQDDVLVGCLHWTTRPAILRGTEILVAQTGPGATRQGHRRQGLMRLMVKAAFAQMRRAGVVLAGQETPVVGFHRRTGWEIASYAYRHRTNRSALSGLTAPQPAGYRIVQPADAADLARFWHEQMLIRPFTSRRHVGDWRQLLSAGADGSWWISRDPYGAVNGYAKVAGIGSTPPSSQAPVLMIEELVADNCAAVAGLVRSLTDTYAANAIEWWSPAPNHYLAFSDPRVVTTTEEIDKLARVVDAQALLDLLARALPPASPLNARVLDGLCEWNDRHFILPPATHEPPIDGPFKCMTIDTRALASAATGALTAAELRAADLLDGSDQLWDRLFTRTAASGPWFPDPL